MGAVARGNPCLLEELIVSFEFCARNEQIDDSLDRSDAVSLALGVEEGAESAAIFSNAWRRRPDEGLCMIAC